MISETAYIGQSNYTYVLVLWCPVGRRFKKGVGVHTRSSGVHFQSSENYAPNVGSSVWIYECTSRRENMQCDP